MAFNMLYWYFILKNKEKFKEWAKQTRKYAATNSKIIEDLKNLEKELGK